MLDFLLALLGSDEGFTNEQGNREVTQLVCPRVDESGSLQQFYELLLPDEEAADRLTYNEDDEYEFVSVETYGKFPLIFPVTNELRIIITKADDSCRAIVFHKTL
jgi:hypothetical protein